MKLAILLSMVGFAVVRAQKLNESLEECTKLETQEAIARCVVGKLPDQFFDDAFEVFQQKFNKTYSNDEEKKTKLSLFKENFLKVVAHNHSGKSYSMKINKFSDLSEEEFKKAYLSDLPGP